MGDYFSVEEILRETALKVTSYGPYSLEAAFLNACNVPQMHVLVWKKCADFSAHRYYSSTITNLGKAMKVASR